MGDGPGLVADVGRMSVRFGIADPGLWEPRDIRSYAMADYPTFTGAVVAYLTASGLGRQPLSSVFAVAGAARGDLINLTGSRWYISLSGLEAVLRRRPRAMNECAAAALALTRLPGSAFEALAGPAMRPIQPNGAYLVVSPGTGLGVAAMIGDGERLMPIQTEAGHIAFAGRTAEEARFAEAVARRGVSPSAECLLSAPGLLAAYAACGGQAALERADEVTRDCNRDPAAGAAVRLFMDYLGAYIGDLTLAYGAWDGVFLTGAIAQALQPRLARSGFRARFESKAAFRRQLADVPVAIVKRSGLELIGAAAALHGQRGMIAEAA